MHDIEVIVHWDDDSTLAAINQIFRWYKLEERFLGNNRIHAFGIVSEEVLIVLLRELVTIPGYRACQVIVNL